MKSPEIGNMWVSCYRGCYDRNVAGNLLLSEFLGSECCEDPRLADRVASLRSMTKGTPEYDDMKKSIPCATISCLCNKWRSKENVIKRNPLIVIDIDLKDNPRLESGEFREKLKKGLIRWPYIYAVGTSCSGKGLFAIVLLSSNNNQLDFLGAFSALEEEFSHVNVVIDKQCKDITRLRIASPDPILVKAPSEEIIPYQQRIIKDVEKSVLPRLITAGANQHEILSELIDMLVSQGYSTDNYDEWIKDGFLLQSIGQSGFEMFLRISRSS